MNSEKGIPLPFDEKNDQDFEDVTKRINAALTRLRSDKRLKKTEDNLSKLAECSRGTLRNRIWPITQLKEIKAEEKNVPKDETAETKNARERSREDILQEQLDKNRDQLLAWKFKHDDLAKHVSTIEGQRNLFKNRAESLQVRVTELERRLTVGVEIANVLPIKLSPRKPTK